MPSSVWRPRGETDQPAEHPRGVQRPAGPRPPGPLNGIAAATRRARVPGGGAGEGSQPGGEGVARRAGSLAAAPAGAVVGEQALELGTLAARESVEERV